MSKVLALSEPVIFGNEKKLINECLDSGWVSTAGKFVDAFEETLAKKVGVKHAVSVNSGTSALHIALLLSDVQPGDEVLVPTVTFIAPVNTVRYCHAEPVFFDSDDFYNIDIDKVSGFLEQHTIFKNGFTVNKKTGKKIKAIIPVHVFGNAVDLSKLMPLCRKKNIRVIEDATESLGAVYTSGRLKGKHTGTVGDIGCYSFNGNKVITGGGGGMIVTHNKKQAQRAKYLTTQAKTDGMKYIHNDVGYNYRLNNMQAAMGLAQLKNLDKVLRKKKKIYERYKQGFSKIDGVTIAKVPPYAKNNYWLCALLLDKQSRVTTDKIIKDLVKAGVQARPLWYLNHWQKPYKSCQAFDIQKAQNLYKRTINLPSGAGLTYAQIDQVVDVIKRKV